MLDSAHRPVAGPFPQTTKRPVVGPEVPVIGPIMKSNGASGERESSSRVNDEYKIRAASEAPPRKSFSHFSGIRYSSALPVVRSILRMGCITGLLSTAFSALAGCRYRCAARSARDGGQSNMLLYFRCHFLRHSDEVQHGWHVSHHISHTAFYLQL